MSEGRQYFGYTEPWHTSKEKGRKNLANFGIVTLGMSPSRLDAPYICALLSIGTRSKSRNSLGD